MKNFIITFLVMALVLLFVILVMIYQNQSPSGFDIYVVNTVNQAYLIEIKIVNDKKGYCGITDLFQ